LPYRSNGYMAVGAEWLGISEKAFFDSLDAHKCLSCGSLYFDPWLSLGFQKSFYEDLCPQHNLGWYTFWSIVRDPGSLTRDAALVQNIMEKIPGLKTYAELGCPFNGLLPYLSLREYQYSSKRFWDYPGIYPLDGPVGKYPQVKGNVLNFERIGHLIAQPFNRVQLLRAFPLTRLIERGVIRFGRAREVRRHGVRCYFIRYEGSTMWGNRCKSLGVDCRTALEEVFGAEVLHFEDVHAERMRFDLVAIFNALDHYKDPLKLLREIFQFTDHIYLEGHHGEAEQGKQHFYFLEEETLRALPKLLPWAEVVPDFQGRASENWYSLLLRKKTETRGNQGGKPWLMVNY